LKPIDRSGKNVHAGDFIFVFAGARWWDAHYYTSRTKSPAMQSTARYTEKRMFGLCLGHRDFENDPTKERFALLLVNTKLLFVSLQDAARPW
jgi:hypothetical protein